MMGSLHYLLFRNLTSLGSAFVYLNPLKTSSILWPAVYDIDLNARMQASVKSKLPLGRFRIRNYASFPLG